MNQIVDNILSPDPAELNSRASSLIHAADPAGKYWSPRRAEDVPIKRPQDVH